VPKCMDTAAVYWHGYGRKSDTPVYALDTLLAGHTITGPAILIQVSNDYYDMMLLFVYHERAHVAATDYANFESLLVTCLDASGESAIISIQDALSQRVASKHEHVLKFSSFVSFMAHRVRKLLITVYVESLFALLHFPYTLLYMQDVSTVVIEPHCTATITSTGDIDITVGRSSSSSNNESNSGGDSDIKTLLATSPTPDPIYLSIFAHRFMGIAEQMGRTLQV
jgi:hypothetical protein